MIVEAAPELLLDRFERVWAERPSKGFDSTIT
jgi:hypothetical protein